MTKNNENTYEAPEVKVIILELEQCIMAASIEQLGNWADDQEW